MKFYRCPLCGNIISYLDNPGCVVYCCDQEVPELVPNTSDGAKEKHVPVLDLKGSVAHVKIGSINHPMIKEHHIAWIALECLEGNQRKTLKVDSAPEATFALTAKDKILNIYEYCNLHGLWKLVVNEA